MNIPFWFLTCFDFLGAISSFISLRIQIIVLRKFYFYIVCLFSQFFQPPPTPPCALSIYCGFCFFCWKLSVFKCLTHGPLTLEQGKKTLTAKSGVGAGTLTQLMGFLWLSITWAISSSFFLGWWIFLEKVMGSPAWRVYLWLPTFLYSCGERGQVRWHFSINPPQRCLRLSPASLTWSSAGSKLSDIFRAREGDQGAAGQEDRTRGFKWLPMQTF